MRKKTGKLLLIIFTVNVWAFGFAQGELEIIGEAEHNYGEVREAFRLKSEFILKNKGNNPLYLLRADASKEIKIHASKKKLDPGDTALLQAFYYPVKKGKFKHHISLITSASSHPAQFFIKGEILNVKSDDKNACYSFRQPRTRIKNEYLTSNNREPVTTKILPEQKDHEITIVKKDKEKLEIPPEVPRNEFDLRDFKENNLIFLIDVSGSMIDSNKLQWLKLSVNNLIKNVRDIEKISIVTYRDSVRCLAENKNNADTAEQIGRAHV